MDSTQNQNSQSSQDDNPMTSVPMHTDLPPMPDFSNPNQQSPIVDSTPIHTMSSSSPPSNFFPPSAGSSVNKNVRKDKIIATFLGVLLLVGGIAAGIILILNPQLLKQKAATTGYDTCATGSTCQNTAGGIACTNLGGTVDICTASTGAIGNCCVPGAPPPPSCNSDADCSGGVSGNYLCRSGQCILKSTIINCDGTQCRADQCHCLFGDTCTQRQCDTSIQQQCVNQGRSYCSNYQGTGMTCCEVGYICNPNGYGCVFNGASTPGPTSNPPPPTPNPTPVPTPSPSPSPTPTRSPSPSPTAGTAQCLNVKAYSSTWTLLTGAQLSTLPNGTSIYFCVAGSATTGVFDMGQFSINGTVFPTTTLVRPNTNDFCQIYQLKSTDTSMNILAKIHSVLFGWMGTF